MMVYQAVFVAEDEQYEILYADRADIDYEAERLGAFKIGDPRETREAAQSEIDAWRERGRMAPTSDE